VNVYYDDELDILYIAKKGQEEEVIEIYPGINLEMDKYGKLIGIEFLNASRLLKNVLKPLEQKAGL
jgi:uncharacterized protein YuzE